MHSKEVKLIMEGVVVEMNIAGWWNGRVWVEGDGFFVNRKVKYFLAARGKRYSGAMV